ACPVDAIVGAPRFLHTVINERCTGCELCIAPCPMDCIELVAVPVPPEPALPADNAPCIRCNLCEPVCPEALAPQHLWWHSRGEDLSRAVDLGLERCIECGLCNSVCPSSIDLLAVFRVARKKLASRELASRQADKARDDYEQHLARLNREGLIAAERRNARIAALTDSEH
ncbi:MAG: 4Fe-4S dicluster domain-containing protein, partial [Pseudomonadales bacterium]|nr:4Fe-4S dicluster domain-containing protein [Pseudomonadales bacterium]